MMASLPLPIVIVGAGLMGTQHAAAAVRAGGRIEAVIDRHLSRARALAGRYPTSLASTHLGEALAERGQSVVHVCTPTDTHESIAGESLEAGSHVLVEKPLAPTFAVTRRLFDLAAARRVLLCPAHQFAFQTGMLQILHVLPRFGQVRHVDYVVCSAGAASRSAAVRDDVAFDILPHPFSLLACILGAQFQEMIWHVEHPAPGELRLSASAPGFSTGVVVSMSGRPTMNLLRIVAEHGSLHADLFHGFATFEDGTVSRVRKVMRPLSTSAAIFAAAAGNLGRRLFEREPAYPGLRELVRRFYMAVANDDVNPISPADVLAVAAARDRVVASCKAGLPLL
jgi:predicted dehydrogenase